MNSATSVRWAKVREAQIAAISEAIVDLIWEGHWPLTISEIALRASLSRPTFYKYFPTLGDAMLHTNRIFADWLLESGRTLGADATNAREKLLAMLDAGYWAAVSQPKRMRFGAYFEFVFQASSADGLAPDPSGEDARHLSDPIYELFAQGQADGSIDPHLATATTVISLRGSMFGLGERLMVEGHLGSPVGAAAHQTLVAAWRSFLQPTPTTGGHSEG